MHGKFGFFKGGHACPIILLVVVLIILAITSVVTSTDTEPVGSQAWMKEPHEEERGYVRNLATNETWIIIGDEVIKCLNT